MTDNDAHIVSDGTEYDDEEDDESDEVTVPIEKDEESSAEEQAIDKKGFKTVKIQKLHE